MSEEAEDSTEYDDKCEKCKVSLHMGNIDFPSFDKHRLICRKCRLKEKEKEAKEREKQELEKNKGLVLKDSSPYIC